MTDKSLRIDKFKKNVQSDQKEEEEMKTPTYQKNRFKINLTLVNVLIEPASK